MFDGTLEGIQARDCVAFFWAARRPLADQWNRIWGRLPDGEGDLALAWWIARAENDAWTFEELAEWAAALEEVGEDKPLLLSEFAAAVLRGKRKKPKRRKNAADPYRDLMMTLAVDRLHNAGLSQSEARRLIGAHEGMDMKTVESAKKRAQDRFSLV